MKQLFLALLLAPSIQACIVEHHHFIAINEYLCPEDFNHKTLIVLDIDNTIAQPETLIGGEEWVTHMMNTYTNHPDIRIRYKTIAPLYYDVVHTINFIPVEHTTAYIIRQLQQSGVIVIGLTARSFEIMDRTIEQLHNIGIDLSRASLWHEDMWHDCHLTYCHMGGIIFCDGNDKGKVLTAVFERLNYCPCKIIAVDDKERHLHAIAKAIDPCIEFIGIRYGHLDEKVRNFDTDAADEELVEWMIRQWLFERY